MSKKGYDLSLNDTTELRQMILDNPELPLLIFAGDEAYYDDYAYTQADVTRVEIRSLATYEDMWLDKDDLRERLTDEFCDFEEYAELTDEQFYGKIDDKINNTEFIKAIVVYVG